MRCVKSNSDVLARAEAVRALAEHRLPTRALAITFDDGYADNHDVALPILRRLALPATFFTATGFLDGGCMFNDIVIEAVRGGPRPPGFGAGPASDRLARAARDHATLTAGGTGRAVPAQE